MRTGIVILTAMLAVLAVSVVALRRSARAATFREATELAGGDPHAGRQTAIALGCVACHEMPGFRGTKPQVGPSLAAFAQRSFVAGVIENTPDHVTQFLRDPRSIAPRSAMPKLRMTERQARDLAAFLYTLR
jgi:cytochrome c2